VRMLAAKDILIANCDTDSKEQLNTSVVKYLKNKYSELLLTTNSNLNVLNKPNKIYEIFTLDAFGGKTFLIDANELPDGENRDLYYNFEIANKIYQKIIDIKDSTFNEYEEVTFLYEKEILKKEMEIMDLKSKDNQLFEKDTTTYNLISQTPLYRNYQLLNKDKEHLLTENQNLNKTINNLNQKLRITLEKIEYLQKPKTFFEKFKDLFKRNKNQIYLTDMRGEK